MTPQQVASWKNKQFWCFDEFYFLMSSEEPPAHAPFGETFRYLLGENYEDWRGWYCRSSIYPRSEPDPCGALLPPVELLKWAATLDGVEIPEIWHSIFQPDKSVRNSLATDPLGERQYSNLMATIGILALALAESKGPRLGSFESPNVSAIAETCRDIVEQLPPGLAQSSLRNRISKGVEILKEAMVC